MTESEAEDWLAVALGEVAHYPLNVLSAACSDARRTCTHHAKIVPAIIAAAETSMAHWRRIEAFVADAPRLPPPSLSDEDFARIVSERGLALSAYLDRGVIVANGDGTFRKVG